jgi:hypothetical protein
MHIIGLLATFNEERLIAACLEHHFRQGIQVYLLDNCSTDRTVAIAQQYLGQGLLKIETLPRQGMFELEAVLTRKQELAFKLEADWFMHFDADEMRLPPQSCQTLAEAIAEVDSLGYNAVNFLEFNFLPTIESPDHDHPLFFETMRWYYLHLRNPLHRVNAWKKQPLPVNLAQAGGHWVKFPEQLIYPVPFKMRHYQCLSRAHAIEKYSTRKHPPAALAKGWHKGREQRPAHQIQFPSQQELEEYNGDETLSFNRPRLDNLLTPTTAASNQSAHKIPANYLEQLPARMLTVALWRKIIRRYRSLFARNTAHRQ